MSATHPATLPDPSRWWIHYLQSKRVAMIPDPEGGTPRASHVDALTSLIDRLDTTVTHLGRHSTTDYDIQFESEVWRADVCWWTIDRDVNHYLTGAAAVYAALTEPREPYRGQQYGELVAVDPAGNVTAIVKGQFFWNEHPLATKIDAAVRTANQYELADR